MSLAIPKSYDGRKPAQPVGGISYVSRIIPINTSACPVGSTLIFELPGNLPASYLSQHSAHDRNEVAPGLAIIIEG